MRAPVAKMRRKAVCLFPRHRTCEIYIVWHHWLVGATRPLHLPSASLWESGTAPYCQFLLMARSDDPASSIVRSSCVIVGGSPVIPVPHLLVGSLKTPAFVCVVWSVCSLVVRSQHGGTRLDTESCGAYAYQSPMRAPTWLQSKCSARLHRHSRRTRTRIYLLRTSIPIEKSTRSDFLCKSVSLPMAISDCSTALHQPLESSHSRRSHTRKICSYARDALHRAYRHIITTPSPFFRCYE